MKSLRSQFVLGAVLLALVAAVWMQQSPGWWRGPLSRAEADDYLARIERQVPLPADEKAETLKRLRAFAEADDGKPVYMVNVMRLYDKVRVQPGQTAFDGTPAQANAYYEDKVTPLALKGGVYPVYAGNVHEQNLFGYAAGQDRWSRMLVVRYPSRRAFLAMIADPAYGPIAPYKLMSLELLLTPTDAEMVLPDLRLVSTLLSALVFAIVGWRRAARRARA
jgi:hypothetical protein